MAEPYLDEAGDLIPEEAWRSFVDGLEQGRGSEQVPISPERKRRLLQQLQECIVQAVKRRLPRATAALSLCTGSAPALSRRMPGQGGRTPGASATMSGQGGGARENEKIGLLFSGGIDSTLIAFILQKLGVDFACVTLGFRDGNAKEPEDVTESRRIARELGFDQEIVLLGLEEADALFKTTAAILGEELADVVNLGVGAVEVAGIARAKELGIVCLFGGLGAEELFAGYDRHEQAFRQDGHAGLAEERVAGLRRMHARDLRRDCAIARAMDVTLATPFLDEELARFALSLSPELLIDETRTFAGRARGDVSQERLVKKLVLREAAEAMGLPHDAAFRPKRAAQYGARTNNALTRLTALRGFRHKEEYLASLKQH